MTSILRRRALAAAAVLLVLIGSTAACTPAQLARFHASPKADQQRLVAAIARHNQEQAFYRGIVAARNAPSRDCHQAIDRHWPAGERSTAHRVMRAESGNVAHAKNSRSSATGCFQLLSIHDHRYPAVGCSPRQKVEPDCNVKAAAHLFRENGWRPWSQTV